MDLKLAYNMVPRNTIMEVVERETGRNNANIISLKLQPMTQTTQNDKTGANGTCGKEMSQVWQLSCPSYTVYKNTYAKKIKKVQMETQSQEEYRTNWDIAFFADKPKLLADTKCTLQGLLDGSIAWETEWRRVWCRPNCVMLHAQDGSNAAQYTLSKMKNETAVTAKFLTWIQQTIKLEWRVR